MALLPYQIPTNQEQTWEKNPSGPKSPPRGTESVSALLNQTEE